MGQKVPFSPVENQPPTWSSSTESVTPRQLGNDWNGGANQLETQETQDGTPEGWDEDGMLEGWDENAMDELWGVPE